MKYFSLAFIFAFALTAMFGASVNAQTLPAGCTAATGYSSTTGVACNGAVTIMPGCATTAGFSTTTGLSCNGATNAVNGYNGSVFGANGYLNGCTSTAGYSTTTGYACNMTVAGSTTTGTTTGGTTTTNTTSPGLPTTGAGGNTFGNLMLLLSSGLIAILGITYSVRRFAK